MPVAVDVAPPDKSSVTADGYPWNRCSHLTSPVVGSIARSALYCSGPFSNRLAPPLGAGPPGVMLVGLTGAHVTHVSRAVTKNSCRTGSNDGGMKFVPPR